MTFDLSKSKPFEGEKMEQAYGKQTKAKLHSMKHTLHVHFVMVLVLTYDIPQPEKRELSRRVFCLEPMHILNPLIVFI